jgi:hypothetical protein
VSGLVGAERVCRHSLPLQSRFLPCPPLLSFIQNPERYLQHLILLEIAVPHQRRDGSVTAELHHLLGGQPVDGQLRAEVMAKRVDRSLTDAGDVALRERVWVLELRSSWVHGLRKVVWRYGSSYSARGVQHGVRAGRRVVRGVCDTAMGT